MNIWNIECLNCGQNLRLTVPDEKLGKTVEAICPKCGSKTRTTIAIKGEVSSFGPDLPDGAKEAFDSIIERIKNDPEITAAVERIQGFGFASMMIFALIKTGDAESNPEIKVDQDGNIKPGTFSASDKQMFHKAFKIKL